MSGATVAKNAKAKQTKQGIKACIKSLSEIFAYGRTLTKGQDIGKRQPRVDLVNEQLCDDVVRYLAPTLEQHKGCTLIDIYPGTCLLSAKLHDLLKPKRHLLLEPEDKYVEEFIKPLLDTPGSTYHRPTISADPHPGQQWRAFRHILDGGSSIVPDRPQLSLGDPRRKQFDPSLLVVGNLLRRYNFKRNQVPFDLSQYVMQMMTRDVLTGKGFQANGLTRMLFWIPETQKHLQISTNRLLNRSSHNVIVDLGADVHEVVGVTPISQIIDNYLNTKVQTKRLPVLEDKISEGVAQTMQEVGMVVPEHRQTQTVEPVSSLVPVETQVEPVSPFANLIKDPEELRSKIDKVSQRLSGLVPDIFMSGTYKGSHRESIVEASGTVEYPQTVGARSQTRQGMLSILAGYRAMVVADIGLRIVNLEASYSELAEGPYEKDVLDELRAKLLALDRDFNDLFEKCDEQTKVRGRDTMDDTLAFFASPPLLMRDRRPYEPLQMELDDVFPFHKISLIDMVPRGDIDLSVPDLASGEEGTQFVTAFMRALFIAKSRPLPAALDHLAINASKDLIPLVPAITDARRGGRLNPMNVSVKMITTEMVEGLVKAFFEWPFRPQRWEIALASNETGGGASEAKVEDVTEDEK